MDIYRILSVREWSILWSSIGEVMRYLQKGLILILMSIMLTGCVGNPYKSGIKSLKDGEYSKAAEEFLEAIEEEKNLTDSYRGLGIALWEEQDYQGAYEAFENALAQGTEQTATIYSLLGNCAMELEKYDQAVEYYELCLSMEDISDELLQETEYNLIAAYEYAGDVESAKECLETYIEKYPDDESALREADFLETR